tara:strand:- start:1263 stop:1430 length:168 start_codon:yes stop_codon:yes gene_type:complete
VISREIFRIKAAASSLPSPLAPPPERLDQLAKIMRRRTRQGDQEKSMSSPQAQAL